MSYMGEGSRAQLERLAQHSGVRLRVMGPLRPRGGPKVPTVQELIDQYTDKQEITTPRFTSESQRDTRASTLPCSRESASSSDIPRYSYRTWKPVNSTRQLKDSTTSPSVTADLQSTDLRQNGCDEDVRSKAASIRRLKEELRRPPSRGGRKTRRQNGTTNTSFPATLSPLKDRADVPNLSGMAGSLELHSTRYRENNEERISATAACLLNRQLSSTDTSPPTTPTPSTARRLAAIRSSRDTPVRDSGSGRNIWPLTERSPIGEEPLQATGTLITRSQNPLSPALSRTQLSNSPHARPPPVVSPPARTQESPVNRSPASSSSGTKQSSPVTSAVTSSMPSSSAAAQRRTQLISTYSGLKTGSGASASADRQRGKATKPVEPRYTDPFIGAPPSFQQRLAELSSLESETVRYERLKRIKKKPRQDN